jgi:ABC-type hemin transport system substrate-binding protein
MTIIPFLNASVFAPQDIQAMSTALEDVCKILNLTDKPQAKGRSWQRRSSPLRKKANAVPLTCGTSC